MCGATRDVRFGPKADIKLHSMKNKKSVKARQAKLSVRPGVVLSVLYWRLRAGDALLRGRGLSSRGTRRGLDLRQIIVRRRLDLRHTSAHEVRRHVGCRRWRCGEISYRVGIHRIGMPRLWQTDAVAGDYRRRTGFQRCIRNEQQRDQRQTDHCKKGESWHCRVPTRTPSTLSKLRLTI